MQMIGSPTKLLVHELQEPAEPHTHRATDPAQRDALQQELLNERPLLLWDDMIFWIQDKGPATSPTAMILFTTMNVAVSLEPRRSALGTCFSCRHNALIGLPSSQTRFRAQRSMNVTRALPGSHHLPLYSPDLNPIEQDFATLKKLRKYHDQTTLALLIKSYKYHGA